MALQVWLPLNGDLNNRGLADVTVTNSGAVVDNNGKIGKCYSFALGKNMTTNLSYDKWNFGQYSVSFGGWFKFNRVDVENALKTLTYTSNSTPTGNLLGAHSYGGFALVWSANNFYTNQSLSSFYIFSNIRNSNSNYSAGNINVEFDKWFHVFTTYDKPTNTLKLYKDGVLVQSYTIPTVFDDTSYTHRNFDINDAYVWGGNGPSCSIPCVMNDIRIYDHCLSLSEVKELGKGLVLHYPLNDAYIESTTNLGNTSIDYHNMTYGTAYTASSWGGDVGTCTFYPDGGYNNYPYKVYHKTATGTGGIYRKTANDITIIAGKTYTMSVYVKASRNFTESSYSFNINGVAGSDTNHYIQSGRVNFTTDWQRLVYTFTAGSADAGTYGEMSIIYNDEVADYYVYYSGFQIEEGNHATPFVNGSRSNTIVYDCSGYGNNGTITATSNIKVSQNSSRYDKSYEFDGVNSSIQIPVNDVIKDNIFTMNVWIYKDGTWGSKGWETIFGGPSGFEYQSKRSSTNSPSLVAYSWGQSSSGGQTYEINKWNMVTMVRTSSDCKFYLNGNLYYTGSAGSIPSGNYFIGAWSTATGQNYKGLMSDFRLYSTALSQEDIQELYNTSAKISKNGTLFCYELKED